MPSNFSGQVAIITGASSGIGRAIALNLAGEGAGLALVGRRLEALKALAGELPSQSGPVCCYRVDLDLDESILDLTTRLEMDFPRLDILIHSAGVMTPGSLRTALAEDFDRQYRLNLRAPFLLTQAVLPKLIESQGQLVFINSSAGLAAGTSNGLYAATKHGLKALADSFREELNPLGVRVLSVYPGRTAGPMQEAIHTSEGREYHPERLLQPADVAAAVTNALSLPRTAEVTNLNIRPMKK